MSGVTFYLPSLPIFLSLFPIYNSSLVVPFLLSLRYLIFQTCFLPIFRNCLHLRKKNVICGFSEHSHDRHEMSFLTYFSMAGLHSSGRSTESLPEHSVQSCPSPKSSYSIAWFSSQPNYIFIINQLQHQLVHLQICFPSLCQSFPTQQTVSLKKAFLFTLLTRI